MRAPFQWNASVLARLGSLPRKARALLGLATLAATLGAVTAIAQTTPPLTGIAATAHNLSKTGKADRNVKAESETQVCVFCHTPHNASTTIAGPLWNRSSSAGSYTRYTSASMDADSIANGFSADPGGSSVLCLSCHDGMVAIGSVLNLKGKAVTISMTDKNGAALTYMPDGDGQLSGFTRNLQQDLSNDHPISVTYDDALAAADGEMTRLTTTDPKQRDLAGNNIIGIRSSTYKPLLPLEATGSSGAGQVQCATCHDPHLEAQKFLRTNRFQVEEAGNRAFDKDKDQICLACHPKLGNSWAESAHAKKVVADEYYIDTAASRRGFPGTPQVWQVGCLNCHDTHTAQGSRRLLREGVNATPSNNAADSFRKLSAAVAASALDTVSAVENTCYQCHTGLGTKIIGSNATSIVPNIEYEFNSRSYRMPIKTEEQTGGTTTENHNIRNANFVECRKNLGGTAEDEPTTTSHLTAAQKTACNGTVGSKDKRHVECTDCHNPHRVRRSPFFYGTSSDTGDGLERTHKVAGTTANKGADGNVASGVLRGTWGVEPVYTTALGNTWPQKPDRYEVKYGDPTSSTFTRSQPYLTREYQLCFKCHSDYSNPTAAVDFPSLGNTGGGTASGTNGVQRYTNVAAEFGSVKFNTANPDIPGTTTDQGETTNAGKACGDPAGTGSDCAPTPSPPGGTNNHRSWHPVMYPTGRDKDERGSASWSNIKAPFSTNVGRQTMYCSDCHGDPGAWAVTTGKAAGVVQGPHGSNKPFLLKGDWSLPLATGPGSYTGQSPSSPGVCGNCHQPTSSVSGFAGATEASHGWSGKDGVPCTYCHVAVPHGWKNKAFLVNTACVGPESGITQTYTNGCASMGGQVNAPPYYRNALLRINAWRVSGAWAETACGDGTGKTWMTETCQEGW
ncbi:cytochrome c3 family protein [Noviherbaspirillum sp. ST9]|uniref:cytochrome c3 family protein n=1 Tax=Noviherbaspirillum sp. ST9 TaxID=3401606 RepID=UPI003B588371